MYPPSFPNSDQKLTDQAKGDVNDVPTAEILKLEQSIKGDDGTGAFKLGQR